MIITCKDGLVILTIYQNYQRKNALKVSSALNITSIV